VLGAAHYGLVDLRGDQREMKDKFRETFEVMRGDVLRGQYGQNPWQDKHQVVTSVSWISRVDDARESLLRSSWDLTHRIGPT
jgi:hypothetical protein